MSRSTVTLGYALTALIDHRGKTPKKLGGDWTASGHRVVSAINIKGNRVDANEHHFVSGELYARWMKVPLRAGDVLLTSEAPTGEVAYLNEDKDWCLGQRVFGLRSNPQLLNGRYLFYQLRGGPARSQLLARATGTTVSGIRQSELVKVQLDLPPLQEQQDVADILGSLDERIESNRRVIEHGTRLLDLLSRCVADAGLDATPLGKVARASTTTVNPASLGDRIVDLLSIPAFDEGTWPERVQASTIKSHKLLIQTPAILVSRLNPRFNRTWYCVPRDGVPALASTEFVALSLGDPSWLGALWLAVRDEYFMSELRRRVTGTSGSHQRIRSSDALAIDVPDVRTLPIAERQTASDLLTLVHQRRRENQKLADVRDSLLPELLSGRIRVSEAAGALTEAST